MQTRVNSSGMGSSPNDPQRFYKARGELAYCLLLTAYCLLLTAYCLLLTAYCLLLTAREHLGAPALYPFLERPPSSAHHDLQARAAVYQYLRNDALAQRPVNVVEPVLLQRGGHSPIALAVYLEHSWSS